MTSLRGRAIRRSAMRRAARTFWSRPTLSLAIAAGVGTWLLLSLLPLDMRWSTRSILAWDAGSLWFVAGMMHKMRGCSVEHIQAAADRQDEGQGLILALVLIACVASLASIAAELNLAKSDHGLGKGLRVALAGVTVAGSWFMVQLIFALHYAHEYYSDPDGEGPMGRAGGLGFPGDQPPDYWDFLHFAVVIGAAAQTADITFTSKAMRRTGTMHSIVAFTFNTVVLALSINLLASLV